MKNYEYFLFDWDGCLAKTLEVWLDATRLAYRTYGVEASDQEIAHHFGDWKAARHFGIEDADGCMDKIVKIADEKLRKVELYEGAKELLTDIKKSKKLALLSSSAKNVIERGLEQNGLQGMFDIVISGDDVTNHKPHPEVIEKGMQALNASKVLTVMIGDSRKDLEAATNAGIDSILIYPQTHKLFYDLNQLKRYNPNYVFGSFKELQGQLKSKTYGV